MTERTFSYIFAYRSDMLAFKNGLISYFVGSHEGLVYAIDYGKGQVSVTYEHDQDLSSDLERIARAFDSRQK
ncbi:hypothetical protein JavanS176_0006 [Streptococcus satellite phage Javan176]|uniref:hypothetical protein n=1 Tax=Streptococcus entericus TaxID=155680 RepID=UPI000368EC5B|nr:hypothetical protein [Streptococcus entericus]QBX07767.1 hypothetical protein JavanS176_0006 [Streptococcus satellite phage Javan176]